MTSHDPVLGIFGLTTAFGEVPAGISACDAAYAAQRDRMYGMQAIPVPPSPYRPRSIDPTQKLSEKAAHLLSINHLLRPA